MRAIYVENTTFEYTGGGSVFASSGTNAIQADNSASVTISGSGGGGFFGFGSVSGNIVLGSSSTLINAGSISGDVTVGATSTVTIQGTVFGGGA